MSGAKDTHVVVWDTVSETGLFRCVVEVVFCVAIVIVCVVF